MFSQVMNTLSRHAPQAETLFWGTAALGAAALAYREEQRTYDLITCQSKLRAMQRHRTSRSDHQNHVTRHFRSRSRYLAPTNLTATTYHFQKTQGDLRSSQDVLLTQIFNDTNPFFSS